jgi:hypothetical protein
MAGVLGVIWGNREAEYFYGEHWTNSKRDLPGRQRNR